MDSGDKGPEPGGGAAEQKPGTSDSFTPGSWGVTSEGVKWAKAQAKAQAKWEH